jgi:soluble lytic murein transglycosylase-like protein
VLEERGRRKLDAEEREGVARALAHAEAEHGVPVVVALAMIELESGFDPDARGPAGAIGLMQLQPATARAVARRVGLDWQSDRMLRDPETNARLGLAYLVELRTRFGTTDHALAAYNMGPGNLRRLLERRPLRRGPYLKRVYARVDALREAYGMDSGSEPRATQRTGPRTEPRVSRP